MELLPDSESGIARAAELLRVGEVVAFPTETVYGLGADATRDDAVQKIYEAKGRPAHNPLIVHVPDANSARSWAAEWPAAAQKLAEAFWPGPITLVVPASNDLSSLALAGGTTVGLRVPGHSTAIALLRACGVPLAAPSANRSGSLSPTEAQHVAADLEGRIPAVLDGGPCDVGIESTVVDVSEPDVIRILRPGMITRQDIITALCCADKTLIDGGAPGDGVLRSPGLLDRHYAPRISLKLKLRAEIKTAPQNVFTIDFDGGAFVELASGRRIHLPGDPAFCAANLYRILWHAQSSGAREIWFEVPPEGKHWHAIHDRLRRAAEPNLR